MNKILPIILVIVLSGCQTPYTANQMKKLKFATPPMNLWLKYSECSKKEMKREKSFMEKVFNKSFTNTMKCFNGYAKIACRMSCSSYEQDFIDYGKILLKQVKNGEINNSSAQLEMHKHGNNTRNAYNTYLSNKRTQEAMLKKQKELEAQLKRERESRILGEIISDNEVDTLKREVETIKRGY